MSKESPDSKKEITDDQVVAIFKKSVLPYKIALDVIKALADKAGKRNLKRDPGAIAKGLWYISISERLGKKGSVIPDKVSGETILTFLASPDVKLEISIRDLVRRFNIKLDIDLSSEAAIAAIDAVASVVAVDSKESTISKRVAQESAIGSDETLATDGHRRTYWYSFTDMLTLLAKIRKEKCVYISDMVTGAEYPVKGVEHYSSNRENRDGLLITDPHYIASLSISLQDIIKVITGTHENVS